MCWKWYCYLTLYCYYCFIIFHHKMWALSVKWYFGVLYCKLMCCQILPLLCYTYACDIYNVSNSPMLHISFNNILTFLTCVYIPWSQWSTALVSALVFNFSFIDLHSPWHNHHGWLGVKKTILCLSLWPLCSRDIKWTLLCELIIS